MKVSVIIPAHNAASFVATAVRSALDQTLRDIEVIVVDDCSDDNTASAAEQAAQQDPRVIVLRSESNIGPGPARNLALDRAQGEWLALLDADDTFAPQRLEAMLKMAEQRNADLMADNLLISSEPGSASGFPAFPASFMRNADCIRADRFIAMDRPDYGTRSVGFMKPIMRTHFLRSNGIRYDARFRNGEDFHFYVRALLAGARLYVTPETWYRYFLQATSQCRGVQSKAPQQIILANDDLLQIAISCGDKRIVRELYKRQKDIDRWIPYAQFAAALKRKDRAVALKRFFMLPSYIYAVKKLSQAAFRRALRTPEAQLS